MEDKGLAASVIYYIDDTNMFDKVNIAVMHVVIWPATHLQLCRASLKAHLKNVKLWR